MITRNGLKRIRAYCGTIDGCCARNLETGEFIGQHCAIKKYCAIFSSYLPSTLAFGPDFWTDEDLDTILELAHRTES